jgi:hypothetical protein
MKLIPPAILLASFILTGCGGSPDKAGTTDDPAAAPAQPEEPAAAGPKKPPIVLGDGLTESEFIALAGPPSGEILIGERKVLSYEGVTVHVIDGRVTELPPDFKVSTRKPHEAQTEQ